MEARSATVPDVLEGARRHVVVIGAFSKPKQGKARERSPRATSAKEVLAKLECSLATRRRHKVYDEGDGFWTHDVSTWSRIDPSESDGGQATKEIPAHSEIMRKYFGDPGKAAHEVGGHVLGELVEACETAMMFSHSHFAKQLVEAVYAMRSAKNAGDEEKNPIHDGELKIVLNDVEVSQCMIEYLRASEAHKVAASKPTLKEALRNAMVGAFEDMGRQRPEAIAKEITADVETLARWLGSEDGEASLAPAHLRILDGEGEGDLATRAGRFEKICRAHPVPGHEGTTLRKAYATFRDAHDRVERIAQCEPLMTFVSEWYLATFCADDTVDDGEIARAVFARIYETNRDAQPNALPADVREAATAAHDKIMRAATTEERPSAVEKIAEELTRAAIERRSAKRSEQVRFTPAELDEKLKEARTEAARQLLPGIEKVNRKIEEIAHRADEAQSALGRAYERTHTSQQPMQILIEEVKPAVDELSRVIVGEEPLAQGRAHEPAPPHDAAHGRRGHELETLRERVDKPYGEDATELCGILSVGIGKAEGEAKRQLIEGFVVREGEGIVARDAQVLESLREVTRGAREGRVAGAMPAPGATPARRPGALENISQRTLSKLLDTGGEGVVVETVAQDAAERSERWAKALPEWCSEKVAVKIAPIPRETDAQDRGKLEGKASGQIGQDTETTERKGRDGDTAGEEALETQRGKDAEETAGKALVQLKMTTELKEDDRKMLAEHLAASDNALAGTLRAEVERRTSATRRHHEMTDRIITDARFSDRTNPEGAKMRAAMLQATFSAHLTSIPERSPLNDPDTSLHAWLTLLVLAPASEISAEFEKLPERGERLAAWRQGHEERGAKAIAAVPLWTMVKGHTEREEGEENPAFVKRSNEAMIERLTQFVGETKDLGETRTDISSFYEEIAELETMLGQLGEDCEITIINDTVERCTEVELWQAFTARAKDEKEEHHPAPPSVIYITRQGTSEGPASAREKIARALGLADDDSSATRRGPLGRQGGQTETNIQNENMSTLVSVPLIVSAGETDTQSKVPSIGIADLPAALAVPVLTGALREATSNRIAPWNAQIGAQASANLGKRGIHVYPHTRHYDVLRRILTEPKAMRAFLHSQVATAACAIMQLGPCKDNDALANGRDTSPQETPTDAKRAQQNLDSTVRSALNEIEARYRAMGRTKAFDEALMIRTGNAEEATWQSWAQGKRSYISITDPADINIGRETNEVLKDTLGRILPATGST